jgi:hypothetical protein
MTISDPSASQRDPPLILKPVVGERGLHNAVGCHPQQPAERPLLPGQPASHEASTLLSLFTSQAAIVSRLAILVLVAYSVKAGAKG